MTATLVRPQSNATATKNLLIIVHMEESFRDYDFEKAVKSLCREIRSGKYDRIVHCTSNITDFETIPELKYLIDDELDWGWGYEPDCFDEDEQEWVLDASGQSYHEYTWVHPEMRDPAFFEGYEVFLAGGCSGECLADMEVVLDHLEISYIREENAIY